MGEYDSEGSGDCHDSVEVSFHAREKESDCSCGSDKCGCNESCPKFKSEKSVPHARIGKVKMIIILLCVILFWAIVYYFSLS